MRTLLFKPVIRYIIIHPLPISTPCNDLTYWCNGILHSCISDTDLVSTDLHSSSECVLDADVTTCNRRQHTYCVAACCCSLLLFTVCLDADGLLLISRPHDDTTFISLDLLYTGSHYSLHYLCVYLLTYLLTVSPVLILAEQTLLCMMWIEWEFSEVFLFMR